MLAEDPSALRVVLVQSGLVGAFTGSAACGVFLVVLVESIAIPLVSNAKID